MISFLFQEEDKFTTKLLYLLSIYLSIATPTSFYCYAEAYNIYI